MNFFKENANSSYKCDFDYNANIFVNYIMLFYSLLYYHHI